MACAWALAAAAAGAAPVGGAPGVPDALASEDARDLRSPDPALRAAALRGLLRRTRESLRTEAGSLRPALRRALGKDDAPEVRGLAARALLRLDGDAAAPHVLDAMAAERAPEAEVLLAAAWADCPTDAARLALARAASDREDVRRAALAAEALGALPASLAADDLHAILLDGGPWPVVAGACLALRALPEVRSITALVPRVGHPDPAVRSAAREALAWLTGEDRGGDPRVWEAWWEGAKGTFRFPDGAGPPRPADPAAEPPSRGPGATSDRPHVPNRPTWAQFFGLPIRGDAVAFAIDYSQSMWGERRAKAERELVDAVKALPTRARVSVVLFNEKVWWFRDAPFPARPQEKWDLTQYLPELETKSYTNLCDACEEGLGLLGVGPHARKPAPGLDDLILLTDGVPNRGRLRQPDQIAEAVAALNARRARISCVALAEEGAALLKRLAAENGGGYAASFVAK